MKIATFHEDFGLLLVNKEKEVQIFMEDMKDFQQTNEIKNSKEVKKETTRTNEEEEVIIAYAQMVFHTLKNSATEITPKSIRQEVKMFYGKFGNKEVKRLANIIMKEKRENK